MTQKLRRLRTQLSLSMILTAVIGLVIFIVGMVTFYLYLQQNWLEGLDSNNRQTLQDLIDDKRVDPDALTTLISTFSMSWDEGYAAKELTFLILFVVIAVVCAIIIGIVVARRISRPIEVVTEAALQVAEGNLDFDVKAERVASIEASNLLQAFRTMTQSLQRAERETTASAAAIAHELRTPLTVLRGRLQGLGDGVFDPNPQLISALLGQVETLSRIVDDLSILSKMATGEDVDEMQKVDLAAVVRSALTGLKPDLEQDGFSVEQALETAPIQGEPARIRQALNALLENARRYAASGMYVRIETGVSDEHAFIRVIDRGPGIEAKDREHVFDRWWRAEASRTRAHGGSGLGLAVAHSITEAHDGVITVSDNPSGNGAVFTIRMPEARR